MAPDPTSAARLSPNRIRTALTRTRRRDLNAETARIQAVLRAAHLRRDRVIDTAYAVTTRTCRAGGPVPGYHCFMPVQGAVVEPTARRIRVRLGGVLVADSSRAQLLIEYGRDTLPTYYVPREDVLPGVLVDEKTTGDDSRRIWTVSTGIGRAVDAAWTAVDSTGNGAVPADYVTFSWQQLEWYEEDERVVVHARDPHKRVDVLHSSRRVEVFVAGEPLASSVRPMLLFETFLPTRYYLPFADVRTELLVASDTVSRCPYKGEARYWSIRVAGTEITDVAWSYPNPIPENPKIRGLLCFFNEKVDLVVDGVPLDHPKTPWSEPEN